VIYLKVLFASGYNPFQSGSGPGGCLYNLSRALVELGCEVHILTPQIATKGYVGRGVTVHYYVNPLRNHFVRNSWVSFSFFSIKQIKQICRNFDIDIVNGHSPTTFAYSFLRNEKIPFIVSAHGTSFGEISSLCGKPHKYLDFSSVMDGLITQPVWAYLTHLEYKCADKVHVVSNAVANELISYNHLSSDLIYTIPNGVNLMPIKESFDENLILSAGRMVWRKGFLYLINAMPDVLKEYPKAKLLLIGDGLYKQRLIERVNELNLKGSITFSGCIKQQELFKLYSKAHIYVQPSLYEPLGNTVLEAMASERPVVASRVGGISEIIYNNENGLLVDPANSGQLASAINLLLSDKPLCSRIGKNAKRTTDANFSWEAIAKKTLKMYQDVIDQYGN
jgi:glycosyltransferase involved in cell wall biosynthesis